MLVPEALNEADDGEDSEEGVDDGHLGEQEGSGRDREHFILGGIADEF